MSTIYDDASLILYPSGYKASKLYSLKPTDGSGDLDVVRATTATRVNSDGLIEEVGINVPRIDYTGGGCGKLLLEPQRTNLIIASEDFSNPIYTKINLSVTSNSTISPDGTENATLVTPDAALGNRIIVINVPSSERTNSVFLKKKELEYVVLGNSSSTVIVDLTNGTLSKSSDATNDYFIESYANQWYKVSIHNKTLTSFQIQFFFGVNSSGQNIATNGSDGLFIWGAQLEEGSYATSYIPTVAAAVTRNADEVSKTGISSLIGQTEGTIYWEGSVAGTSSIIRRLVSLSDGTTNNAIYVQNAANGTTIQYVVVAGGSVEFAINVSLAFTFGQQFKIAAAYNANDFVIYINGVQVGSETSGSVPATSKFAFDRGNDTTAHEGDVAQALLFPTRLTNSELETLTTP